MLELCMYHKHTAHTHVYSYSLEHIFSGSFSYSAPWDSRLAHNKLSLFLLPCSNLVIGGDDISHDSKEEKESYVEYHYTWFTNGYTTTKSGQRVDLAVVFLFEGAEMRSKFQVSGCIFFSEASVCLLGLGVDFITWSYLFRELCSWLRAGYVWCVLLNCLATFGYSRHAVATELL